MDKRLKKIDRLSNLLEDILLKILSLLEMKDAFRTFFLSKEKPWSDLWKHTPTLVLDIEAFPSEESFESFVRFVYKNYDASRLRTINLNCGTDIDESLLECIIKYAAEKCVKNLRVSFSNFDESELPLEFITDCKSLTSLYLLGGIFTRLPQGKFHLPWLTRLRIAHTTIQCSDHEKIDLFSQCVNLETLILEGIQVQSRATSLVITCPKLVTLEIKLEFFYGMLEKILISAPRLESISYTPFDSTEIDIDGCPCLRSAKIDFDDYEFVNYQTDQDDIDDVQGRFSEALINSLTALRDVKSLTLSRNTLAELLFCSELLEDESCPFRDLKTLKLQVGSIRKSLTILPEVADFLLGGPRLPQVIVDFQ